MTTNKSTLYINTRQLGSWRVADNSLVTTLRTGPSQYFPLNRLLRVVFIGTGKGTIADLLKLATFGIPIAFLSTAGQLTAFMFTGASQEGLINELAERLRFDGQLEQQFKNWQENQTAHVKRSVQKQISIKGLCCKATSREVEQWLYGLARTQLFQIAAKYRLDTQNPCVTLLLNRIEKIHQPLITFFHHQLINKSCAPKSAEIVRFYQQEFEPTLDFEFQRLLIQLEVGANQWL